MGIHKVALDEADEAAVGDLVASGRFADAGEALRAGLRRLVGDEEAEWAIFLDRVNAASDEAERGELADGSLDEVMDRVTRVARGG